MAKLTLEIKYDGPKTHQIGPEISQHSMQDRASLEGQKDHQTKQGERGSPLSDFEAQKCIKATENSLDFSG